MSIVDNTLETKNKLLASAEQEFIKKGFEKASLRTICKNAGLTTGALYFFFKNKEDIFDSIVKNFALEFKNMIISFSQSEKAEWQNSVKDKNRNNFDLDIDHEKDMLIYLYMNKAAFILLASKAQGSSYENYYSEMVELLNNLFGEFFRMYCDKDFSESKLIKTAIHYMVSWRVNSYVEILQSDLSLDEVIMQAGIIASYAAGGFMSVINSIK